MARPLASAPLVATADGSIVAPVEIDGLPEDLHAAGLELRRKGEFHVTALIRRAVERCPGASRETWQRVCEAAVGRSLHPILPTPELRIARDDGGLATVVVMVSCPALAGLVQELRDMFSLGLRLPPAHVTLYSSDGEQGIGLPDASTLARLAPPPPEPVQRELRDAIGFAGVFAGQS